MTFDWVSLLGWGSATMSFYTVISKTLIPLRCAAIAGNALGLAFALAMHNWSGAFLNAVFLPINLYRLYETRRLFRRVRAAADATSAFDTSWITPFMTRVHYKSGDTLFERGNEAENAFVIVKGRVALPALQTSLPNGALIGEMGLFTRNRTRTATARCETDVEALRIKYEEMERLFVSDSKFAFFLVRLITERYASSLDTQKPFASSSLPALAA